jgi:hypothetical protein
MLWRLLAAQLAAPSRLLPVRLVWEVHARPDHVRVGLWIPPGISSLAVGRDVERAWPGARIERNPDTSKAVICGFSGMSSVRVWYTRCRVRVWSSSLTVSAQRRTPSPSTRSTTTHRQCVVGLSSRLVSYRQSRGGRGGIALTG